MKKTPPITCPRCDAKWLGLKIEHCRGGFRTPHCHLTFSSTRVADAHLVEMDERGWSRHLTVAEMLDLHTENGDPRYAVRLNTFGTEVIGRYGEKPPREAPQHQSDGLTDVGVGETP